MSPKDFLKKAAGYVAAIALSLFTGWLIWGTGQPSDWETAYQDGGHTKQAIEKIMTWDTEPIITDSVGDSVIAPSLIVAVEKGGKPYFAAIYRFSGTLLNPDTLLVEGIPKPKAVSSTDTTGVGKK